MYTLEAIKISKNYAQGGKSLEILKNLDLQIKHGETVSIVGQSGSGKSTLLSVLAGLDSVDSGKILINSQEISQFNEKELCDFRAQNVGIVFQQYHLMPHLNALENVMLPLEIAKNKEAKALSEKILSDFGLLDRMTHMPHQLSGGESQRVAIARAMVHSPKIIFADEPSGNLDTQTGVTVMNLLFKEIKKQKISLVLVTHNNDLANECDIKLKLQDGKLI